MAGGDSPDRGQSPFDVERLATLEEQAKAASEERFAILKKLDRHDYNLETIKDDVHAIRIEMSSFRGFWKGVLFAVSTIAAGIGAMLLAAWNWLTEA